MGIEQGITSAIQSAVEAGWSLNQIAVVSGVPQPRLQDWYTGRQKSLSLAHVERLAAHFGMTLTKPRKNIGRPK